MDAITETDTQFKVVQLGIIFQAATFEAVDIETSFLV